MDEKVKKILEKKFGYDFESDWFTDEILTLVDDVIEATKESMNGVELTYEEKVKIYEEAKGIFSSSISWEEKYDLIFSNNISKKMDFDWYDPDCGYDDDVIAFMNAFDSYMIKQEKLHKIF